MSRNCDVWMIGRQSRLDVCGCRLVTHCPSHWRELVPIYPCWSGLSCACACCVCVILVAVGWLPSDTMCNACLRISRKILILSLVTQDTEFPPETSIPVPSLFTNSKSRVVGWVTSLAMVLVWLGGHFLNYVKKGGKNEKYAWHGTCFIFAFISLLFRFFVAFLSLFR